MKVIIPTGPSTRLLPLTKNLPKCLLKEIFALLGEEVKPEDLPGTPTQTEENLARAIEAYYGQKVLS